MSWKPTSMRRRLLLLLTCLLLATATIWTAAGIRFSGRPALLTAAGISYSLGLRHALDADHISAIDNVTRKLMMEQRYSTTVGFYFSLGHSTLVIIGCLALYWANQELDKSHPTAMTILSGVSSGMACLFLIFIGSLNLWQLLKVASELRRVKREKVYDKHSANQLQNGGFMSCCAGGVLKMVDKSWKMIIVGIIFGLGFDTTASVTAIIMTAVDRLGDSASVTLDEAIILSLLFTAGMVTLDTADSVMMLGTYVWSDQHIIRRLFFNFMILLISIFCAFFIGLVIGVRLIVELSHCDQNGFCKVVVFLDDQFQYIGIIVTSVFILVWVIGYFYYKNSHWSNLEKEVVYVDTSMEKGLLDDATVEPCPSETTTDDDDQV